MKIGDKIRLVRIPPWVKDDGELNTRTMLTKCLGREFPVKGFQLDGGRFRKRFSAGAWVELDVGQVNRDGHYHTLYVPPDCVERLTPSRKKK